ncbi:MAG: hypothetical protein H0U87_03515 [Acidobacteria bacterium]|nr:hypothetical protein [Acidobacteriota bacterium]
MIKKFFVSLLLVSVAYCFLPWAANAQKKRDSLTEAEIELVRDAQAIDERTAIFVRAVERRFLVLNNQIAAPDNKKLKKEAEKWGEPPAGTRLQLLTDIKKILAEAIGNIDDVAAHDKMDDKLFPKAVRKLAEASNRFLPELKSELAKSTDEREKGAILSSIESCEQIIEASAKVPKEDAAKEKKKKGGN